MLPPRQTKGFMLVKKPDNLFTAYQAIPHHPKDQEHLKNLRTALSFINPANYRGISREPLEPWMKTDEDLLRKNEKTLVDLRINQNARRKFLEINGEDREQWDLYIDDYNLSLIQDLVAAEEIKKLLDSPSDYEIIEITRDIFSTEYKLLGFDIGLWEGDHFSLISDSAVMPHWHPPAPDSIKDVKEYLSYLNEFVLFSNIQDAEKYCEYYKSQSWAEEELALGKFCIIQVASV